MENHSAMIAALLGALIGSIVTAIDHVFSFVAVVTAVFTAAARYYAILRGAEKSQLDRTTAYGFFVGFVLSLLLLILDRVVLG